MESRYGGWRRNQRQRARWFWTTDVNQIRRKAPDLKQNPDVSFVLSVLSL
jgi:hypothetical protein